MRASDQSARPNIGARELQYENPHQRVYKVRVDFGDASREIFVTDYGYRVGVVVEGPRGILLTRQHRHLIDSLSWEIPGGKVDPGENLEDAARRECAEETGVLCGELKPLLMFHPGLETLHNPTHLFHSSAFEDRAGGKFAGNDEVSAREWIALDACISMISSGKIMDSLSVVALLSYRTFVRRK